MAALPFSKAGRDADMACELLSGITNGNCDKKASRLKSSSFSGGTVGKEYVWRAKARSDANLAGAVMSGTQGSPSADTAHLSNGCPKSEINSGKSSNNDDFNIKSSYANGNDDPKASGLKKSPNYTIVGSCVQGKDYVWRVRAGQDANSEGEILRGMQTDPSLDLAHGSNGRVKSETSSQSSGGNGFNKSCYPNSNSNHTQSRLKTNPASVGTLSSVPGKDYVWRPRKGQDINLTGGLPCRMQTSLSGNMAYVSNTGFKSETYSKYSHDNGFSKSCIGNTIDDSQVSRLKRNPISTGTSTGVVGKDYVWRVRAKGTPNETKPSTEEANKNFGSACSSGAPLSERDANSSLSKDFEDFLLDMLGKGFQLERSAIQEVLGNCGYDMKKSLETVLDLAAVNLDRRNSFQFHKEIKLNSNSETLSSQIQGQKQKLSDSGRRTMRSNGILSRPSNERESTGRSEVAGTIVTEPQEDIAKEHNAKASSFDLVEARDEAEEDGYHVLRKTVKEYRDTTKEYYKAAAEAFASGDRARASILLEKGQFFYNKAREADEESAEKIFEISRDGEMQDDMCLDLQHRNVKEAVHLLKRHLCSLSGIQSIKNLKIIFGMGEQNVGKCKRAVIKILVKEAIEWIEDADCGTLSIRLDQINPKHLSFTKNSKAI